MLATNDVTLDPKVTAVLIDASRNDVNVTLAPSSKAPSTLWYRRRDQTSHTVTINAAPGEVISTGPMVLTDLYPGVLMNVDAVWTPLLDSSMVSDITTGGAANGDLLYLSGDNACGLATSAQDATSGFFGVCVSSNLIRVSRACWMNVVAGLAGGDAPVAGKLLYLSATPGKATTQRPALESATEVTPVGRIIDASKYGSAGQCFALIQSLFQVAQS